MKDFFSNYKALYASAIAALVLTTLFTPYFEGYSVPGMITPHYALFNLVQDDEPVQRINWLYFYGFFLFFFITIYAQTRGFMYGMKVNGSKKKALSLKKILVIIGIMSIPVLLNLLLNVFGLSIES